MSQPVLTRAALALGLALGLAPAGAVWGQACTEITAPALPSSPPAAPALPPLTGTPPALTEECAAGSITFTDVTGADVNTTYSSNAVALGSGFAGSHTATCSGCMAISRNGVWGGTSYGGFTAGDTVAIRVNTGAGAGVVTTATVTLGGVTSGVWSVTTTGACAVGVELGGTCPDGSIYAGFSPDGSVPMYTTPCDHGQSLSGSCTGTRSTITWNNGTSNWTTTGFTSALTGRDNTAGLYTLSDAGGPYNAARTCAELSAHGHSDWYLPANDEMSVLYTNHAAIGGFLMDGSHYWSSSEHDHDDAIVRRFSNGHVFGTKKNYAGLVRCVRR